MGNIFPSCLKEHISLLLGCFEKNPSQNLNKKFMEQRRAQEMQTSI